MLCVAQTFSEATCCLPQLCRGQSLVQTTAPVCSRVLASAQPYSKKVASSRCCLQNDPMPKQDCSYWATSHVRGWSPIFCHVLGNARNANQMKGDDLMTCSTILEQSWKALVHRLIVTVLRILRVVGNRREAISVVTCGYQSKVVSHDQPLLTTP